MNLKEINHIIESLNADERKLLPHLKEKSFEELCRKAGIEEIPALRALEFLSNKGIVNLKIEKKKIVELGVNGVLYRKKDLPERRLINLVAEKKSLPLEEAKKSSGLLENEFQAALGVLKKKALINLEGGNLIFLGEKEEITKKTLDEIFIESLPLELEKLNAEQKYSFENLKNRKNIIEINTKNQILFEITELGKEISSVELKVDENLLGAVTPEIIAKEYWKSKKFRRYDVSSPVPKIYGGKRHFVNQAIDYARKIWSELGFKEMSSTLTQTGFWNFDALFTAQDHSVREIQDTFYIKEIIGKLPDKKIVSAVKQSHEKGVVGAKGWRYKWNEEEAKKVILRTHTTCISANTLSELGKLKKIKDKRGKFFAIGKCFRNETLDWNHGFEFNQTEGIVIDKNANFRNLLGYLEEFYKKIGFEKVKFYPSFFPYTEPSTEIYGYNSIKKVWVEIGGAGIMRPEVVVPLLGEHVPVLAWGPGFDRTIMEHYNIQDLREMYENNLTKLRAMKFWEK